MKARPTVYAKAPFPREWFTRVDLLTPLSLQANPKIASDLEIYFLKTTVSYKNKPENPMSNNPIKTKTGTINPKERNSFAIPFVCSTNPSERVYTQREIFEDIASSGISAGFDIPDSVIEERCSIIKKPRELEEIAQLHEWDKILLHEVACSHFSTVTYGRFNIRVRSPAKIARSDLVEHYDFEHSKVPIKRMRSVLQLRSVVGLDGNKIIGWGSLYNTENKSNISEQLSDGLCGNNILMDTAIPKDLKTQQIDGFTIEPRIFLLKKHHHLISLKLGPEWGIG